MPKDVIKLQIRISRITTSFNTCVRQHARTYKGKRTYIHTYASRKDSYTRSNNNYVTCLLLICGESRRCTLCFLDRPKSELGHLKTFHEGQM